MADPADLTDEELLAELYAADDPKEIQVLRAACAQRGLWFGPDAMEPREKRRRADEGPLT